MILKLFYVSHATITCEVNCGFTPIKCKPQLSVLTSDCEAFLCFRHGLRSYEYVTLVFPLNEQCAFSGLYWTPSNWLWKLLWRHPLCYLISVIFAEDYLTRPREVARHLLGHGEDSSSLCSRFVLEFISYLLSSIPINRFWNLPDSFSHQWTFVYRCNGVSIGHRISIFGNFL